MIFKPRELALLVAKGKKTQTRRPIVPGTPLLYRVGQDYPVKPGPGEEEICRITILDVKRERLGDLSYEDVLAEGFRSSAEFARFWLRLREDKRHDPEGLSADEVRELWQQRHGGRMVWVLTFELTRPLKIVLPDRPVYLSRARSSSSGTTTDPRLKMPGEPAVIGDVSLGGFARVRNKALRERQQRLQEAHQVVERARRAYELAVAGDVDVDEDVVALKRVVEDLEAKLRAA